MERLADSIQAITAADDKDGADREIVNSFMKIGFDRICLSVNKRDHLEILKAPQISTFDTECQSGYDAATMSKWTVDLAQKMFAARPFWFDLTQATNPLHTRLLELLASGGIIGGAVIPLKSTAGLPSIMMLGASRPFQRDARTLASASALAHVAMLKIELLTAPVDRADLLRSLTIQQHELLRWAAAGKSNTDIATITGLSRRGVDYHMGQIFRKLGVTSKAQAVAAFGRSGPVACPAAQ